MYAMNEWWGNQDANDEQVVDGPAVSAEKPYPGSRRMIVFYRGQPVYR